jgi:hypothetical protein
MRNVKYKCLPYEPDRDQFDPWIMGVVFFFFLPFFVFILIGLVVMYAKRIDSISPMWQLGWTLIGLGIPMSMLIVRVVKKLILNK